MNCIIVCIIVAVYRVIHKSLRDFRPLRYSTRDGHDEGEHVNRGRDTLSFCPTLQVLDNGFGGLEVACWPLVPNFACSHPAETVRFLGRKKSSTRFPSEGEVKPSVPCRSFTACKRSLNVTCISAFRLNYRTFLANSSTFRRWVLWRGDTRGDAWWRKLESPTKIAQ